MPCKITKICEDLASQGGEDVKRPACRRSRATNRLPSPWLNGASELPTASKTLRHVTVLRQESKDQPFGPGFDQAQKGRAVPLNGREMTHHCFWLARPALATIAPPLAPKASRSCGADQRVIRSKEADRRTSGPALPTTAGCEGPAEDNHSHDCRRLPRMHSLLPLCLRRMTDRLVAGQPSVARGRARRFTCPDLQGVGGAQPIGDYRG